MSEYAKALVAFGLGVALVAAGVLIPDETLRQLGYGALAASPLVYAVKNRKTPGEAGQAGILALIVYAILIIVGLIVLVWLVGALASGLSH